MLKQKTPLDYALEAYDLGFKVFPLKPNSKLPAVEDWENWAKDAKEADLRKFTLHNFGLACGPSDLLAIDLDIKPPKNGKNASNGYEDFNALQNRFNEDYPETWKVKTPSGGMHIIYKGTDRTSAKSVAPGIDTRGMGGYVVLHGRVIDGKAYQSINDIILAPLPESFKNLLHEKTKPKILDDEELILEGERNQTLASLAGSMRSRGFCHEAILNALIAVNERQLEDPLPLIEVKRIAQSVARYKPEDAAVASDFEAVPEDLRAYLASEIVAEDIPKRVWLMKDRFIKGYMSATVSPGGLGKSITSMLDALSLSTGKPLSGFAVDKKASTLVYNMEDPLDELQRRMVALCLEHNVDIKDQNRIHLISGRDNPLILAKRAKNGVVINKNAMSKLIHYIRDNGIDLVILDPFIRFHEVNENDNMEIDKVAWCIQRIIEATGCAICVIHHTRKMGRSTDGGIDTARGASALANAARVGYVISEMSEADAKAFGIPEDRARWYIRLDNAKANMQPPAESATWFQKTSVRLPNEDVVGALRHVELVDISKAKECEEIENEASHAAGIWAKIYAVGDLIPIADARLSLGSDSFLFNYSDKRGREKLVGLLRSGLCTHSGKLFSYHYNEGKKSKHYMKVQDIEFLA